MQAVFLGALHEKLVFPRPWESTYQGGGFALTGSRGSCVADETTVDDVALTSIPVN